MKALFSIEPLVAHLKLKPGAAADKRSLHRPENACWLGFKNGHHR
jgi:hypothetical protein